jgi:hypothetical protein
MVAEIVVDCFYPTVEGVYKGGGRSQSQKKRSTQFTHDFIEYAHTQIQGQK